MATDKFRFYKVRFVDGTWKTYKKLPKLKDYYAIYVSISRWRNPLLVDKKYSSTEERIKKAGFIDSDMWFEVDADDFNGNLMEAYKEILRIKEYLDKHKPELEYRNMVMSGGGYYLFYELLNKPKGSEMERFKYYKNLKLSTMKELISNGFKPDYTYNPDGSLNSPILNLFGVRRHIWTENVKRGRICSLISDYSHTVPRRRNKTVRSYGVDDWVFPSDKTTGTQHSDERLGGVPYASKVISNVVDKNFAFPVFKYYSREFSAIALAMIQQEYNLSTIYVYKKKDMITAFSIDKLPKSRIGKILKRARSISLAEWIKYENIYFSISSDILPDRMIENKEVCQIIRENKSPKVRRFRRPKIKVVKKD